MVAGTPNSISFYAAGSYFFILWANSVADLQSKFLVATFSHSFDAFCFECVMIFSLWL